MAAMKMYGQQAIHSVEPQQCMALNLLKQKALRLILFLQAAKLDRG